MSYITRAQLVARLGEPLYARLTDRMSGTTADDAIGQQIIDEAEAEVDSYLAQRYRTPIDLSVRAELAVVLAARVLDLAEFIAWKSSPFVSDPPERVEQMYAAALSWLRAVATGALPLPAEAPPAARRAVAEGPRVRAAPRAFTHRELDGL